MSDITIRNATLADAPRISGIMMSDIIRSGKYSFTM